MSLSFARLVRLTLPLAAAAAMAAAASPAVAGSNCAVAKNKACAHDGAFCRTSYGPGKCETYRHRAYRATQITCTCRPNHLHH